ncbi:hypothetical protein ABK046_40525 [Streptomyces caeruleatus]
MSQEDPRNFNPSSLISSLPKIAFSLPTFATITAATGFVLFAVLNRFGEQFYNPLNIDPIEVGIGYQETLFRSYGFLAVILLGSALLLAALSLYVMAFLVITLIVWLSTRGKRSPKNNRNATRNSRRREWWRNAAKWSLAAYGVGFVIFSFTHVYFRASDYVAASRESVRHGREVAPLTMCKFTALDLSAPRATVRDRQSGATLHQNLRLLYMGTSNGISLFYNSTNKKVIRIPSSSITVETSGNGGTPSCSFPWVW